MGKRSKPPTPTSDVPAVPMRGDDAHKGTSGHVAIIAGSVGMSGAACLAGIGALRVGAGLVRVLCAEPVLPIVAGFEPSLMTVALPATAEGRLSPEAWAEIEAAALSWAHAIAVGPGLGMDGSNGGVGVIVEHLVERAECGLVVDADGLNNAPSGSAEFWSKSRPARATVLTPHPGEMRRLRSKGGLEEVSGQDDESRVRGAHEYASQSGATVVLKGHRTVVAERGATYINTTGNAGMATGGMGDVLTGMIAGLLGQGMRGFDAARLGVYLHGAAGDRCVQKVGPRGYLARELADEVPGVLGVAGLPALGFR